MDLSSIPSTRGIAAYPFRGRVDWWATPFAGSAADFLTTPLTYDPVDSLTGPLRVQLCGFALCLLHLSSRGFDDYPLTSCLVDSLTGPLTRGPFGLADRPLALRPP